MMNNLILNSMLSDKTFLNLSPSEQGEVIETAKLNAPIIVKTGGIEKYIGYILFCSLCQKYRIYIGGCPKHKCGACLTCSHQFVCNTPPCSPIGIKLLPYIEPHLAIGLSSKFKFTCSG